MVRESHSDEVCPLTGCGLPDLLCGSLANARTDSVGSGRHSSLIPKPEGVDRPDLSNASLDTHERDQKTKFPYGMLLVYAESYVSRISKYTSLIANGAFIENNQSISRKVFGLGCLPSHS